MFSISSGSALFAKIKDRNTPKYRKFNLWPLKIQNGQFHTYTIKMHDGKNFKIHQNEMSKLTGGKPRNYHEIVLT